MAVNGTILAGIAVNILLAVHLINKDSRNPKRLIAGLLVLAVPFVGALMYFLFFYIKWPQPQPFFMRQNRRNNYGRTEFGGHEESIPRKNKRDRETAVKIQRPAISPVFKVAAMLVSLYVILLGVLSILKNRWSYSNWWGAPVFGPAAIVAGALMLIVIYKKMR